MDLTLPWFFNLQPFPYPQSKSNEYQITQERMEKTMQNNSYDPERIPNPNNAYPQPRNLDEGCMEMEDPMEGDRSHQSQNQQQQQMSLGGIPSPKKQSAELDNPQPRYQSFNKLPSVENPPHEKYPQGSSLPQKQQSPIVLPSTEDNSKCDHSPQIHQNSDHSWQHQPSQESSTGHYHTPSSYHDQNLQEYPHLQKQAQAAPALSYDKSSARLARAKSSLEHEGCLETFCYYCCICCICLKCS